MSYIGLPNTDGFGELESVRRLREAGPPQAIQNCPNCGAQLNSQGACEGCEGSQESQEGGPGSGPQGGRSSLKKLGSMKSVHANAIKQGWEHVGKDKDGRHVYVKGESKMSIHPGTGAMSIGKNNIS